MNDQNLFLQTAKQIDFVEFYLCYKLYDICNDKLIAGTTHSNFIGWLNLRTTDPPIILLPRKGSTTKTCFLAKKGSKKGSVK